MEHEQQQWRRLSGERIKIPIADEVSNVLTRECEAGHEMKVCIGTDSQVKGKETEFATVIVFIRKGKGGFMYIRNEVTNQRMSIKPRMLMEVHADINTNPNFKSNDALKESMGYIVGMGFAFKAKPEAFASSNCANKIVQ